MAQKSEAEERLEVLERDGKLNKREVVQDARPKTSPLHDFFEWNDREAGEAYRLIQADDLIRTFKLRIVIRDRVLVLPKYVRDPDCLVHEEGRVSLASVKAGNEERQRAVLLSEVERVLAALNRARSIATYFGIEEQVDHIVQEVRQFGTELQGRRGMAAQRSARAAS